jgi:hypothetical protein
LKISPFFSLLKEKKQKRKKWSFELNQKCTIKGKKKDSFFLLEKGRCIVTNFFGSLALLKNKKGELHASLTTHHQK